MALIGDEGRDKLRKVAGIGKYELIRKYPNGTTHSARGIRLCRKLTQGTETSKYLEEKKTKVIP